MAVDSSAVVYAELAERALGRGHHAVFGCDEEATTMWGRKTKTKRKKPKSKLSARKRWIVRREKIRHPIRWRRSKAFIRDMRRQGVI